MIVPWLEIKIVPFFNKKKVLLRVRAPIGNKGADQWEQ